MYGQAYADFWRNYGNFEGRSTRMQYWVPYIFNSFILIAFCLLFIATHSNFVLVLAGFFLFSIIIPSLAMGTRRFHDAGFPGWVYGVCILGNMIVGAGSLMIFVVSLLPSTES